MRHHRPIARATLVHLNGPPGIGKSTIASGLVQRRPLALDLDIDQLRVRLGRWEDDEESKRLARSLGFGMASTHLAAGHDVVLPQLLVRFEVVDHLARLAHDAGAELVEVLLVAPVEEIVARFGGDDGPHPRALFTLDELRAQVVDCLDRLRQRTGANVVDVGGLGPGGALQRVAETIGW